MRDEQSVKRYQKMQLLLKDAVAAHAVARAVAAHDVAAQSCRLCRVGGSRDIHRCRTKNPQNRVEMEEVEVRRMTAFLFALRGQAGG